jgi:alpha-L-fucosidase 2
MQSQAVHGAVNMIMRFRSTRDCDYARKVYQYLTEVADFYEDYLWFEDGRYFIFNEVGIPLSQPAPTSCVGG